MSAFMVSNNTIDLIVQAAFKSKVISKRSRSVFGQALITVNDIAMTQRYGSSHTPWTVEAIQDYRFTAFPRKYKRAAVHGALSCFEYQASEWAGWGDSEVRRLLNLTFEANAKYAGYEPITEVGTNEDGDEIVTVTTTATEQFTAALRRQREEDASLAHFWDITDHQRDPESTDYDNNVMVRHLHVIEAEREAARVVREAEAERIRLERMALATEAAAQATADEADEWDGDWDDDDEDIED